MNAGFFEPLRLLFILALIPVIFLKIYRFRKNGAGLSALFGGRFSEFKTRSTRVTFSFALAWIFLVIAASGPYWGTKKISVKREGSSVFFVMDISRSMTATDVSPDRLSYSSAFAMKLAREIPEAPCGVILVKGGAVLALPLTRDRLSLAGILDALSPSLLTSTGSALAEGVSLAAKSFPENSSASRVVVFFTDGEENALSLEQAVRAAIGRGVTIVIVGIGTKTGGDIILDPASEDRELHRTVMHEDEMKRIAAVLGRGVRYVNGLEVGSAKKILDEITGSLSSVTLVHTETPLSRYPIALVISMLCFIFGLLRGGIEWKEK